MKNYFKIVENVENELKKTKETTDKPIEQSEFAIGHCKIALDYLREAVIKEGFPDRKSEILFFKKIKPSVYSKLLYYQAVFDMESTRLEVDKEGLRKYFQMELKKILKYMKKHKVKVQYYRSGHSHLDEKYFTRKNDEIPLELKDSHSLIDEEFSAWHDHTFSQVMANEMLIAYIKNEMEKLDHPEREKQILPKSPLKWTGTKMEMAEIIYALQGSDSVNNGDATIKDLTKGFEWLFNIDLKDIYSYFPQIQQRKIDPVKFLNKLIAILLRRIDDSNK